MAYSTKADILDQLDEDVLVQLTDDEEGIAINNATVTRAIADADATIDAYCRARYAVPFSPVPEKVRSISVDITIYNLYSRRLGPPPHRKDRFDGAIKFLERISDGTAGFDDELPAQASGGSVDIEGNDRIFTRDKMSGF